MAPNRQRRRLSSVLDIERDEIRQTLLMFGYNFLIISAHTIIKALRDALFLHQVGAEQLPYVYIGIALIAGLVMQGYTRLAQRTRRSQLVIITNLFFIANTLIFWWLFHYDWSWLSYVLYIWAGLFSAISVAQFWLIANDIFNPRQAKRLFGLILGGGTLGGIAAGVVSRAIVNFVGTESLFLVAAVQLLGCAIVMRQISRQIPVNVVSEPSLGSPAEQSKSSALKQILGNKHLTYLAMIIAVTVMATTLVDFQFKSIVQESYESKDALTGFFGIYYACINAVTLAAQLFVTGSLLRRFGVGAAILIMPIGLFIGSVATFISPVLWAAILVKVCDDIFSLSINKWGTEILYIPIPASIKLKAKTFIDVVVERTSRGLGGLLLLLLINGFSLAVGQLSLPVLVLLVVWIFLGVRIYREYVGSLEATLRRRGLNADALTINLSDSSTINQLMPLLDGDNERQTLYALKLLQDAKAPGLVERLEALLQHPSAEVRLQALRALIPTGEARLLPQVETLLNDDDHAVKTEAIHYMCVHGKTSTRRLQEFLAHPDLQIKEAAVTCIVNRGYADEYDLLTEEFIQEMLQVKGSHRVSARMAAAKALSVMDACSHLKEFLWELLNDRDNGVVHQAMISVGKARCAELVPFLIQKLGNPSTRVIARTALAEQGPSVLNELVSSMEDASIPMRIRRQIPGVLGLMPYEASLDALFDGLHQDGADMLYRSVRALGKLRTNQSGVRFHQPTVREHLTKQIRECYYLLLVRSVQENRDSLLEQALRERLEIRQEIIFRLLGLIYSPQRMYRAYRGVISRNARIRANAVELLDNILERGIKRQLLPMFDEHQNSNIQSLAGELWGLDLLGRVEAIGTLIEGRDTWLQACALYVVGQQKITDLQPLVRDALESTDSLVRESAEWAQQHLENYSNESS